MAVAPMLKAIVLGHRSSMDRVLCALQRAGVLDIVASELDLESEEIGPEDERRLHVEERLADALFVRDFLARFHVSRAPFSTFVSEKVHLTPQRFHALEFDAHTKRLYRECVALSDRLASGERERERLQALVDELKPWAGLRLQIAQWTGTEHTVLLTGTVPSAGSEEVRQRLCDHVSEVTVEELGPAGDRQAWVVIAARDAADDVRSVLAAAGFAEVSFPGLHDYPAEEIETARVRIAELDETEKRSKERALELAEKHYLDAVALVQALESARDKVIVHRDIARTERAFVMTGWVEERRAGEVEAALRPWADEVDVTFEPPAGEDEPPVALENPAWLKPFELLTDLYGRPPYRGIDPTPLFAPFFILFFALCIGDVGYGAMLIAGAWLIKHRLDVTDGVKRFMDLLMIGGAASMVVGVLLGSYLALPVESLPAPLRALQVIDPVADIQQFLVIALVIGLVQVFFGVFVAAWSAFSRGDAESAIFDQLSIVFLFTMLGVTAVAGVAGNGGLVRASLVVGLVGAMVMQGRAIQAALRADEVASWDRMLGIAWVVLFVGGFAAFAFSGQVVAVWAALGASAAGLIVSRSVRRGVVGVLSGAYNVYGLTGFVGDVLSYLRLPALGLSGMLVGSVFNILTSLVWGGVGPLISRGGLSLVGGLAVAVLAVALFAVGHTFNVVINLLGAFVHPTRLQFVEFFSKFYEAGGRPFTPFGFRTDGIVLDAGAAGEEGGRVS